MAPFPDTSGPAFKAQEQLLLSLVGRVRPRTVLEPGCGWGRISRLLLRNVRTIRRYDGFDLSPERVEAARAIEREFPGRARFSVADLLAYSPAEKYDLVLAVEVLMHIPPAQVGAAVGAMVARAARYAVSLDWSEDRPRPDAAAHNFIHPYRRLYAGQPGVYEVAEYPVPGGLQRAFRVRTGRWGRPSPPRV